MLSPLTGGEITFGPRFRLQPAGLGRAPGKATPRKRSPGRSARPRPGKLYPFFFALPAIRERCKPHAVMLCTVDRPSRHGPLCTSNNAPKWKIIDLVVCSSRFARGCA